MINKDMTYGLVSNRTKPGRRDHPYPQGDGSLNCSVCKGRGVVEVPQDERPPLSVGEVTRPCKCTEIRDTLANMERAWRGLSAVTTRGSSPLLEYLGENLRVTANMHDLKLHLARVALKKGSRWRFKVITDVDLLSAWLYSANEVIDPDVRQQQLSPEQNRYSRIEDLVEDWDLLVIRLGVKTARNAAAPEVLLEALQIREQHGRPSWVVDSPGYPFMAGHISYDERVGDYVSLWDVQTLSENDKTAPSDKRVRSTSRMSLQPSSGLVSEFLDSESQPGKKRWRK